jgi:hypothetical protein
MADTAGNGSQRPDQGAGENEDAENQAAERPLEEWSRRAGRFLASAAARAREGAEDILAEAQAIRRGERK